MAHYESIQSRIGRECDFVIRYKLVPAIDSRSRYQGMRTDFCYENEVGKNHYMIYPEFEDADGEVINETSTPLAPEGTARMWVINEELRDYHFKRLEVGLKGHLVNGPLIVADVEVIKI